MVQDLLANMLANITASQCMVVRMAQLQAEGKLTDAHAALAKAFTTAKCRETVAWAGELLGGNGIAAEYNVGRFFADAEALYSYEGTYHRRGYGNSQRLCLNDAFHRVSIYQHRRIARRVHPLG